MYRKLQQIYKGKTRSLLSKFITTCSYKTDVWVKTARQATFHNIYKSSCRVRRQRGVRHSPQL